MGPASVLLPAVVLVSGFLGGGPAVEEVDCTSGGNIGKALSVQADSVEVVFKGQCDEDIVIERSDVTLRGSGEEPAILGSVWVHGASRVRLSDFTVRESESRGIRVEHASVTMENLTVEDNAGTGATAFNSGHVTVIDCTFRRNGFAGLDATNSSSLTLRGTIRCDDNLLGLWVGESSALLSWPDSIVEAHDNTIYGILLQLSGSAQIRGASVSGNLVGLAVYSGANAWVLDVLDARQNLIGVEVLENSYFSGPFEGSTIEENTVGVGVDDGTVVLRDATIRNNDFGDVDLSFGARASFNGTSDIGTVTCDGTVLTRGDTGCNASASDSADSPARAASEGARERLADLMKSRLRD